MARGINKVILIGNLGADPEVRYMPSGGAVANVSIATSESWKDRETGAQQVRTEWHRVVFFNRLGEIVGEYLRKGSKVYIEGSLKTRKWTDKNGLERYTTEIVASNMQMLDSREGSGGSDPGYDMAPPEHMGGSAGGSIPQQRSAAPSGQPAGQAAPEEGFDDDIPF